MLFSDDMKYLLRLFEESQVEYVLVGGFAVNYYGYVRTTQDIDFLLLPSKENAAKVMDCIERFGFGDAGIPRELFEKEGSAIHLGVEPNRIDLLTHLKGPSNDQLLANAQRVSIDDVEVSIISLRDLIESKRASTRPRDQADADELSRIG